MEKNNKKVNISLMGIPGFEKIKSDKDFFSFIKKHQKKNENSGNELFLLVDNKDNIRRDVSGFPLLAYRKDCHKKGSKDYIHRATDFIIINNQGDILLSKRAKDKDTYPGFWETGGGHCGLLSYKETLTKELKEEVGIPVNKIHRIKKMLKLLAKMPMQRQYNELYEVHLKPGTVIKVDNKEVKKSKRHPITEIIEGIKKNTLDIIPGQIMYLIEYILKHKYIKDEKTIKALRQKQSQICKKFGVNDTHLKIF